MGVASNVITVLVNFVIAVVFAIYLLVQKEKLLYQVNKVLKAYLPMKRVGKIQEICKLSNKICANFVSGQCLEAVIIGVLCFIGMLILGISLCCNYFCTYWCYSFNSCLWSIYWYYCRSIFNFYGKSY